MLQVIFGDDEHTASDGAYSRAIKVRKWLYITALLSLAIHLKLYDAEAFKDLVKVLALPSDLARGALSGGLAYLSVVYILLLVQLVVTYDITIGGRLEYRKADDLRAADDRVAAAEKDYRDALHTIREAAAGHQAQVQDRLYLANQQVERAQDEITKLDDQDPLAVDLRPLFANDLASALSRREAVQESLTVLEREANLLEERPQIADDTLARLATAAREARRQYDLLASSDPAKRLAYVVPEILIDIVRLMPPLILAGFALSKLAPIVLNDLGAWWVLQ